jgi:toxin ParE1/3/4
LSLLQVVLSEEAQEQLDQLELYLAERFYPANAQRFVQRLTKACYKIGLAPHQGTNHDNLSPGIRSKGFERRVTIYFKIVGPQVMILGIHYGGHTPHEML